MKMEGYILVHEAAKRWGITERHVRRLCKEDRIEGAIKMGTIWIIPENAMKPKDERIKSGRYIKG